MNQELKEQTIKKFWETVLEVNVEDIKSETIYLVSDENLDSLIDKTVQKTEDRIVGIIRQLLMDINFLEGITGEENRDIVYKNHKKMKEYLSLITNKSELSTNKDEK